MYRTFIAIAFILTAVERSRSISTDRLGYSINSLLVCYVNNPYYYLAGQPQVIPEAPPKIALVPSQEGLVWLPETPNYSPQINSAETINTVGLLLFLGQDFNGLLLSLNQPSPASVAPLPGTSSSSTPAPTQVGSGGGMFMIPNTAPSIDLDLLDYVSYIINASGLNGNAPIITNQLLSRGIGKCVLKANWTLLPSSYFPRYFSGGYCADPPEWLGTCSIPPGLHCAPKTNPDSLTYVPILRWDCCNTFSQNRWKWSCGWRKVLMPIVSQCFCGCT
eukprot:Em0014g639a